MNEFVDYSQTNSVGYITLHRPPQNRANRQLVAELGAAVRAAALSDARVVVVRAEGPDFCLGGDFRDWPTYDSYFKRKERWQFSNGILSQLESLSVPTISAVQGQAFGFGFELALHTDLVVASKNARFRFPEATIAVFPLAGGAQRVAERAGRAIATRLVMFSEEITAVSALNWNIVTHVVPDLDLSATADALAQKLAQGPTRAHAATKATLAAWASGGIAAADAQMIELIPHVLDTDDVRLALDSASKALAEGRTRPALKFEGH